MIQNPASTPIRQTLTPMEQQVWIQAYVAAFTALPIAPHRDRDTDAVYAIKQADDAVRCLRLHAPQVLLG